MAARISLAKTTSRESSDVPSDAPAAVISRSPASARAGIDLVDDSSHDELEVYL